MTSWTPDDNLVATAQAGKVAVKTLGCEDRSWVVAGLTARGITADDAAKLLGCSLRLIRQIRAHPLTTMALYAQTVAVDVETTTSRARTEQRAAAYELEDLKMTAERYKRQRDDLIEQLARSARLAEEKDA